MKKLIVLIFAGSVLCAAPAWSITKMEIMTLAKVGVSADEMIKAIERDKTVFNLAVTEILELKQASVPEKVIKFMLKTPQLFGGDTDTPGGTSQSTSQTADELTPEERAALEAKQRAEAQRLAEEARKADEAQRRAFAQGILKKGMDLANGKNCTAAIQTFLQFINEGGYARGTDEHYTAWFGIANALSKCDYHQSSARYLVDVLLEGPDKPFFQAAFWQLRQIRKVLNYSPPDLEELTRFSVGNFSRGFQDEYNYFLGEFFYDYNNFTRALSFFEGVSTDAADYPKAQYLTGLVQVQNQLYGSAVRSFQNAIVAAENVNSSGVATLSYLALARLAYEAENFDAAVFYYRKVPTDSPKLPTAFYESAWTYFIKGDYGRALGTFQVLHSPYFNHYFYPELWILEATVYLNMCRANDAKEAIDQYNAQVEAMTIPLKRLLSKLRTPADYWDALQGIVQGDEQYSIDPRIAQPVLANVEFYNLYKTVRQIEREEAALQDVQGALGQFGTDLLAKLAALRQSRLNEAGIKVQQVLKQVEAELADYSVKKVELEVDIEAAAMDTLSDEMRGITLDEPDETVERGGSSAIAGSDSMSWNFEGEYWRDEIGGFRSSLVSRCTE
ncbi:MAG: hypothetical protein VX223_01150 [Myxococcota bacterium]|nr:hypothetical protein [Myxococcota bacterium]